MTMVYRAFEPRTITPLRPVVQRGYQLKAYAVACRDSTFDHLRFEPAIAELSQRLPPPAREAGRPGVGFLILHQGLTADYAVLAWWDQQNELPLHVLVDDSTGWRSANTHESICVFDLEFCGLNATYGLPRRWPASHWTLRSVTTLQDKRSASNDARRLPVEVNQRRRR